MSAVWGEPDRKNNASSIVCNKLFSAFIHSTEIELFYKTKLAALTKLLILFPHQKSKHYDTFLNYPPPPKWKNVYIAKQNKSTLIKKSLNTWPHWQQLNVYLFAKFVFVSIIMSTLSFLFESTWYWPTVQSTLLVVVTNFA